MTELEFKDVFPSTYSCPDQQLMGTNVRTLLD